MPRKLSSPFNRTQRSPRGYKATLKARVSDLVKILLFHRYEQEITAYFTMTPDGQRLDSRKLINISKVNGKVTRELIMEVDYDRLTTFWKVYKKGVLTGEGGSSFKAGEYLDDPMCTYYNLRYGVYGQIKYGESLDVKTLPTKQVKTIHLQIPSEEETRKRRGKEVYQQSRQYLVKINTDSEFFESRRGDVEVWFSKDMKPLEAAVKGVAWVGDVRGYLKTKKEPVPKKPR